MAIMTDFWTFYTKVCQKVRHCAHIQISIKGPSIFTICVDQEEEDLLQTLLVGDKVGNKVSGQKPDW